MESVTFENTRIGKGFRVMTGINNIHYNKEVLGPDFPRELNP